jgi:two-component system OmpR family response regulator
MTKRLLLIDDEEQVLHALTRFFSRAGYSVDCARELEEAEALLTWIEYDLVIADLSLTDQGGTEGLEIIRYVRSNRPGIRLILLTANASALVEREALRRGCDVLLEKPKPLAELMSIATSLTEGVA